MRIRVKLFATLSDFLPPGTSVHGLEIDAADDATAHQILDRFEVPRRMIHLVLRNGVYVEPEDRDRPVLEEGDVLAVWPPIAGG